MIIASHPNDRGEAPGRGVEALTAEGGPQGMEGRGMGEAAVGEIGEALLGHHPIRTGGATSAPQTKGNPT